MILILLAVIVGHLNQFGRYIINGSGFFCNHTDTGVYCCFCLNTGTYNRCFGKEQGHCLTLHVGTHQCTVRIIVLQERNQCSSYREYHLRRHIHVIKSSLGICLGFLSVTAGYVILCEVPVFIQGSRSLCYMVVILFVRSHIYNLVRNTGIRRIGFINLTIRCFYEAILTDPRISSQGVNQSNVRSLRSLDRTHTSIVGIVYISNFESCTVSGQTAGTQCGKTSLMGKLTQRVVLIHKLGQLGRTKEFFHGSLYRFNVNQSLRSNLLCIMSRHTFTNHSLQTGETDAVLVL